MIILTFKTKPNYKVFILWIINVNFLFERLLYKKSDYVKKNICWRITSAATSLTTNPPPFTKKKNSRKLNDCQIFNVIKVLGVQKLVFINLKKKTLFFLFFTLAFRKKLVLIILVQRLNSIKFKVLGYLNIGVHQFQKEK